MKPTKQESTTETQSRKAGVMWRLSVLLLLPAAVILLFTNMIVTAFEWILTGTNHRFTSWVEKIWAAWADRIRDAEHDRQIRLTQDAQALEKSFDMEEDF